MRPTTRSTGILFCTLAAVSGCTEIATRDANAFSATREGDTLSGTYNPEGFTQINIRDLLKFDCPTQRLARYRETQGPRTLVTFTATCAA